jgi:1,4-dihydroxy-2-naphthoate octaprenyltransferase
MPPNAAEQIPFLKKWLVAARPWSLPASTMPVAFGTSLAVVIGGVPLLAGRFILSLAAMVILHSGANMLSDVFDFRRGLDREVTPVSGAIVRGWLSAREVTGAAVLFILLGSAIGLLLVWMTGRTLLVIGALGVAIGVFYTFLKYRALGDLAVFLNFGILGSLGAWVVQTGTFSWLPVIWTVPMAMLVSAILHANNWRDTITDRERWIRTVASWLGDKNSLFYYGFLMFGPFFIILGLMVIPRLIGGEWIPLPWTFLLVLAAFPRALALWGRARRRHAPRQPMDFIILDGSTAQYNLIFGLLCTAAVWFRYLLAAVL